MDRQLHLLQCLHVFVLDDVPAIGSIASDEKIIGTSSIFDPAISEHFSVYFLSRSSTARSFAD